MVASACLLALPTDQNYANVCIRDPVFLSQMLYTTPSSESVSKPANQTKQRSSRGPTFVDMNIDLGPLVVCACPSELFWLQLMLRQLTSLADAFAADRRRSAAEEFGNNDEDEERDPSPAWLKSANPSCRNPVEVKESQQLFF